MNPLHPINLILIVASAVAILYAIGTLRQVFRAIRHYRAIRHQERDRQAAQDARKQATYCGRCGNRLRSIYGDVEGTPVCHDCVGTALKEHFAKSREAHNARS